MSIQAMNTSLKNNRNQISKRQKFQNRLGGYTCNNKAEYNLPKATSKQLRDIRKKMQRERKIWWIKVIVVTAVLFLGLLAALFTNFENLSYYIKY